LIEKDGETFLTNHSSESDSLGSDKKENRSFEHILLLGSFVVVVIWFIESITGVATSFDAYGYGITLVVVAFCFWLSHFKHRSTLARGIVFVHISIYLVSLAILGFVEAVETGSIYPLASTMQWMPILYIVAFLFLSNKVAVYSSLLIYLLLLLLLGSSFTSLFPVNNLELNTLMFNMALAHGLYLVCMISVMRLRRITLRHQVEAVELKRAANLDGLLGIANRRFLQTVMDRFVALHQPVSILLIDVDNFKHINDQHGHSAGDEVLKGVVQCMRESLRPVDMIGRWGGEEFLVLADCASDDEAENLAQRIRANVANKRFAVVGDVTVSIGVSKYKGNGEIEATFNQADKALYTAKERGRNQVRVHVHQEMKIHAQV
jgi:diguanylate cyclase (GGDEF)-like protein